MGIREKRKNRRGTVRIKKQATFVAICAAVLCIAISTSFCYADTDPIEKDTSWFDYENPQESYTISTEAQLMGLASLVNEEQADRWKPSRIENFAGVTFTLDRDIKLTKPWTPIGKGGASYFAGIFDGNGHTIRDINVSANADNAGLFGHLAGEVKQLNITGRIISSEGNCGGIAGYLDSTGIIKECRSEARVKGQDKVGGIVGYNDGGKVEDCINTGNVTGTYKIGGIAGENWGGNIASCGNNGTVKSTVRGVATYGTGGVAGRSVSSSARITESYNSGEIISHTEGTGGIAGYINAKGTRIENCYNTGVITITEQQDKKELTEAYAGGIVGIAGINGVRISNCYNAGSIMEADITGGIIGLYINEKEETEQYIFNNYYLKDNYSDGIGEMYDMRDPNLDGAVMDTPKGAMNNLHSSLSVAYMKDTGEYDNKGFPVLKWQKPVRTEEKAYLSVIPEDKQKRLDRYLVRTASVTPPGQPIMNFFEPDNVMSNAFILYMEAKEKYNGENEYDNAK